MFQISFASLRMRLFGLILLAVIPAFGLILYSASQQRQLAIVEAEKNALRLTHLAVDNQERLIEGARQLLTVLVQLPEIREGGAACNTLLAGLTAQYSLYTGLSAVEPDGNVYCSSLPLSQSLNVANRPYIQQAFQIRDFTASEYQIGRLSGKPVLSLAYPVIDETGRSQAVVLAGLDLSWFNQFVTEAQLPAGATFTLIDARGTVLAHYPDLQRAGQSMPETQLLQTILAQSEGTVEAVGLDGLSRLYAFTPLPTLRSAVAETVPGTPIDGYVSLSIPTEIAFAEINQKLVRNLAALAFVAGLGLVAAWFGSEMFILRQVEALLQATRKLSTGDLNTRIKLSTGSEELKQLAHAFDEMAEALQQREIERQRTETASRHSEALLRQILDTNPNIIFVKDREATIILANQALADSYQTTFEQVMGRSHVELHVQAGMSQVELQQWLLDDRDVIDTGKSKTILEQYTHRDGSIHWNQTKKFPLNLVNGQQGVLVISEDITDRKRAEESLRQTAAELTRSNAELQQFAYVASHDLQEPLRMVASYTQLLARRYEGKLDADADVFINFAVDGANRMQQLINDLLAYSRVGTRSKPPQPTEVRVALESVLTNLKMIIAENKAVVTYDHLPTVLADETQLVQLFQNLIGNALKFRSVQPPTVHISAECKDEEWWFSVQDNGIGIESKYAERIFIIFQRLHNKTDYSGSGIGLAICKRIVERLGGRIWMESQPGQGTTFLFTLPAIGEKNEL